MGIPLLLPILFGLGSAGLNYMANNKAQSARDSALAAERIRQRKFDQESMAANRQSQDRYGDFEEDQGNRGRDLRDLFTQTEEAPPAIRTPALPQSDNVTVASRAADSSAEAKDFTDKRAEGLSDFRSFADMFGSVGREQAQDASLIDMIGGFKRGSQSVLPLELEEAAQKGGNLRLLADLFGLGSAMTTGPALGGSALGGVFGGSAAPMNAANVATKTAQVGSTWPGQAATSMPQVY